MQGVIETLREQIAVLMGRVSGEQRVKIQAFEQDKPQMRQLIQALEGSRQVLDAELKELQTQPASAKAAVKKTTGAFAAGFGALKSKTSSAPKASEGSKLSDDELRTERQQLAGALTQLDQRIDGIRQELAHNMRPDERDMWETNLVMMQVCIAAWPWCCSMTAQKVSKLGYRYLWSVSKHALMAIPPPCRTPGACTRRRSPC